MQLKEADENDLEQTCDLITVDELCEILMIGKNMAYKILNSGEIHAFKEGTHWKIPREAVAQYIRTRAGL